METRASSRRRKLLLKEAVETCRASEDRISNLPDDILHHILSLLIKSIAQTSPLSTRWYYLWSSFPCLDFSEFPKGMEMEFITTVLARHPANSNIKVFRIKGHLVFTCLCDCIRSVVQHGVEELKLSVKQ